MAGNREKDSVLGSSFERFTRMMFTNILQRLARFLSETDFTMSQIASLHLVDSRQQMSVQEIAEALKLSTSAASRLIDDLVLRGYFVRTEDSKDRRSKKITCSQKGLGLINDLSVERVKIMKETTAKLPANISKTILSAIKLFNK